MRYTKPEQTNISHFKFATSHKSLVNKDAWQNIPTAMHEFRVIREFRETWSCKEPQNGEEFKVLHQLTSSKPTSKLEKDHTHKPQSQLPDWKNRYI
jgi:hypothetical protein